MSDQGPPGEAERKKQVNDAVEGAKRDIHIGSNPGDFRGTSIFQGGQVKQLSEEAQLVQCPDCGFSKGRHSKRCPGRKK